MLISFNPHHNPVKLLLKCSFLFYSEEKIVTCFRSNQSSNTKALQLKWQLVFSTFIQPRPLEEWSPLELCGMGSSEPGHTDRKVAYGVHYRHKEDTWQALCNSWRAGNKCSSCQTHWSIFKNLRNEMILKWPWIWSHFSVTSPPTPSPPKKKLKKKKRKMQTSESCLLLGTNYLKLQVDKPIYWNICTEKHQGIPHCLKSVHNFLS